MTAVSDRASDVTVVTLQLGRVPRDPWRVAARCEFGYPTAVISPARLADGTPFPTWAWLTCPHLVALAGALESDGEIAEWTARIERDPALRLRLMDADAALRRMRGQDSDEDPCAGVGIAGQRQVAGVKCLHAHVALALVGIDDPIGASVLERGASCLDGRCARFCREDG